MRFLFNRICQIIANRLVQRQLTRDAEKINVIDQQKLIAEDLREAAKTKVLHKMGEHVDRYIEGQ